MTSVILPLRKTLELRFLPVQEGRVIRFERLLEAKATVTGDAPDGSWKPRQGESHVDLVSSPLGKTVERLHLRDGEPVAIEVRDAWWLSHYD